MSWSYFPRSNANSNESRLMTISLATHTVSSIQTVVRFSFRFIVTQHDCSLKSTLLLWLMFASCEANMLHTGHPVGRPLFLFVLVSISHFHCLLSNFSLFCVLLEKCKFLASQKEYISNALATLMLAENEMSNVVMCVLGPFH